MTLRYYLQRHDGTGLLVWARPTDGSFDRWMIPGTGRGDVIVFDNHREASRLAEAQAGEVVTMPSRPAIEWLKPLNLKRYRVDLGRG